MSRPQMTRGQLVLGGGLLGLMAWLAAKYDWVMTLLTASASLMGVLVFGDWFLAMLGVISDASEGPINRALSALNEVTKPVTETKTEPTAATPAAPKPKPEPKPAPVATLDTESDSASPAEQTRPRRGRRKDSAAPAT